MLPEEAISLIRQNLVEMRELGFPERRFRPGDRVAIKSGPFKDLEAVFDQSLSGWERDRVLVDFLGRWTPCEVEVNSLEKVSLRGWAWPNCKAASEGTALRKGHSSNGGAYHKILPV